MVVHVSNGIGVVVVIQRELTPSAPMVKKTAPGVVVGQPPTHRSVPTIPNAYAFLIPRPA